MPQAAAAAQDPNQDYVAVDPKQNPLAFVYQNRDALGNMPEDKAIKLVDRMFKRFALPKYQQMNRQKPLDEGEIENLRLQFAARMFNLPFEPAEQKGPEVKPGIIAKAGATAAAGGAGVIGGLRSIQELREKLQKYAHLEGVVKYDPLDRLIKKTLSPSGPAARTEGKAYSEASATTPLGASVAAGIGHQIPASLAASGVGSILPGAGPGASLGQRVLSGAAKGGIEGATFEASRPGGEPEQGAKWGMTLGAAFPLLGRFFNLGRRAISSAPKAVEAVTGEGAAATAKAASSESKSLGSLADKAAKDKFGKAFKDLTSAEKAQMPGIMKEEIAKQRAQQAATKKAEVAAAKAGREAEAAAKRTAAADAAKQKAAQQAAKRAAIPTQTPAAKQAVAAKAAEENPSIAKTLGGADRRVAAGASPTGTERRVSTIPFKDITTVHDLPTEGEKLGKEIRTAREGTPSKITEGEAMQHLMKDPKKYEAFKAADSKEQGKMLVTAKNEMIEAGKVTKVPEGQTGEKIRAKGGQPASPAQQAADRERIAAKRAEAKQQEFGAALEKHAQQMAGKYTSATQVGAQHIPELEDAAKEIEGGDVVLRGLQKLRRAKKITDEIYADSLKEWLLNQFANIKND